jgi:hypothetical protein
MSKVLCIKVLNLSSNVRLAVNMHMELDWFKGGGESKARVYLKSY